MTSDVREVLASGFADAERRRKEAADLLGDLGWVECVVRTEPCVECDAREARDFGAP